MKDDDAMLPCTGCMGTKIWDEGVGSQYSQDYDKSRQYQTCRTCLGTGVLPQKYPVLQNVATIR